MKIRDVLSFSFEAIIRGKLRIVLTVVSISIGVCSVLLISTLSTNGISAVNNELDKIGFESIAVFGSSETSKLYTDDIDKIKEATGINDVSPMVIVYGNCRLKKQFNHVLFFGIDSNVVSVLNLTVLHGRLPNQREIRSNSNCAVVDSSFALKHYKRENIVGKKLIAQVEGVNREFEIIGIVRPQKDIINQMVGGAIPEFVYLPYTTLNQMRGKEDLTQIALKSTQTIQLEQIKAKINKTLYKNRQGSYEVKNIAGYVDGFRSVTVLIGLFISAIAAISLCVAGLGIMNSMLSSVNERKREIGICMAIGATRGDIVRCFLTEGIMTTSLGCFLGFIFSWLAVFLCKIILRIEFTFDLKLILCVGLLSIICGGICSIIPAIKASKQNPLQSLRDES